MKLVLPIVAVVYATSTCAIAIAEDHLAPCSDDFPDEYDRRIEEIAEAAMPAPPDLWVTVIPSFTAEWSVGVSAVEGQYSLTRVAFDRSFWWSSYVEKGVNQVVFDPSRGSALVGARTTAISAALYDALRAEWDRSLSSIRESRLIVVDGTAFNFRSPDRCATTSELDSATRNGKLVELVIDLARLTRTRSATPNPALEAAVLTKLQELPAIAD